MRYELLQVPIALIDEEHLPRHFCKNCKAKVLSVEVKLQTLRAQAQQTLRPLKEKRSGSRKWK